MEQAQTVNAAASKQANATVRVSSDLLERSAVVEDSCQPEITVKRNDKEIADFSPKFEVLALCTTGKGDTAAPAKGFALRFVRGN